MNVFTGNIETVDCSSVWEIKNFSSLTPKIIGTIFQSPKFKIKNTEWILEICPYGEVKESKNFVALYVVSTTLEQAKTSNIEIEVLCQFSILNKLKQKLMIASGNNLFTKEVCSFGYDKYISRDMLLRGKDLYLFEDKLTILCEIYINPLKDQKLISHEKMVSEIFEDFESLFLKGSFSDLTIVIDTKKLFVHKSILSARNKVFGAKLENLTKEKDDSLLEITDASYDIMKEVLRFIYCGKVENLEKLAMSIIPVAQQYSLTSLKSMCENFICQSLNIDNACKTLAELEIYNCNELKSKIMKFIITNLKQVTLTSGYEELKISKSHLLEEILREVAQKCVLKY